MTHGWATERASLIAGAVTNNDEANIVHFRASAALSEAAQRARTEERKAIAARLREPDEAMVEALTVEMKWQGIESKAYKLGILRAIADALDPSPPPPPPPGETP